jgi:hypothetical protein
METHFADSCVLNCLPAVTYAVCFNMAPVFPCTGKFPPPEGRVVHLFTISKHTKRGVLFRTSTGLSLVCFNMARIATEP